MDLMQLIYFISQDSTHFIGACIILGIIGEVVVRVINAITRPFIANRTLIEDDEEDDDD